MSETEEKPSSERTETQYDDYAAKFRELYESSQARGHDAMERAMETAREYFVAIGDMTAEQGELFKDYLRRDLEQTARDMHELGDEARDHLHPARLGAGALAATAAALRIASKTLLDLATRSDKALTYQAGEITSAGTLTCTGCGRKLQLKQTALIGPCPECSGTVFRKGY